MTDRDETPQYTGYLLGQLSAEDAAAFEDRYFQDDEVFARLEVAADDLAARYAAGALSPADRDRFRTHLLGSKDDRLRVRVSAALAARAKARPAEARVSPWQSLMAVFRVHQGVSPMLAAAAGVILAAGLGVVSWRLATVQHEMRALRQTLTDEQAAAQQLVAAASAREIQERAQREAAEQRVAELATSAFVVVPGSERGGSEPLIVPASTAFVRLELALDRPIQGRCRVTVRTIDRATVWSQDVDVTAGAASVVATLPAAVLPAGQYEAIVQTVQPGGGTGDVGVYGFTVTRRR